MSAFISCMLLFFLIPLIFCKFTAVFLKKCIMPASKSSENPVYSKQTIEFVAVAKSYCDFMDQLESLDKAGFVNTAVRLLPLLYQKALALPPAESRYDEDPEVFATEEQYMSLTAVIADLLGNDDAYLEVFHPEIRFSDTPVAAFISENMADIWQDLFNFISVFRIGYDETMNEALVLCRNNFREYWGQSLVNVLRALHVLEFAQSPDQTGEEGEDFE